MRRSPKLHPMHDTFCASASIDFIFSIYGRSMLSAAWLQDLAFLLKLRFHIRQVESPDGLLAEFRSCAHSLDFRAYRTIDVHEGGRKGKLIHI